MNEKYKQFVVFDGIVLVGMLKKNKKNIERIKAIPDSDGYHVSYKNGFFDEINEGLPEYFSSDK